MVSSLFFLGHSSLRHMDVLRGEGVLLVFTLNREPTSRCQPPTQREREQRGLIARQPMARNLGGAIFVPFCLPFVRLAVHRLSDVRVVLSVANQPAAVSTLSIR